VGDDATDNRADDEPMTRARRRRLAYHIYGVRIKSMRFVGSILKLGTRACDA
jgi:hypothetical protein